MKFLPIFITLLALCACNSDNHGSTAGEAEHGHGEQAEEPARGPHRGRMMADGPFAIELAIFESGVPPEYHAWPTLDGKPLPLDQVNLVVELTRLGGKVDRFTFSPKEDYLRGSGVVNEPHSFEVKVIATHAGRTHEWAFDSFEGRTTIASDIAEAAGIRTETVGPATLVTTRTLYGRITADPSRQRDVAARFAGVIQAVQKKLGDTVRAGETLAVIESNESLRTYSVPAPIAGVITERNANPGEQSGDRTLFTIVDPSAVIAEISIFPADRAQVRVGAQVTVKAAQGEQTASGKIERVEMHAAANQSVTARVSLNNSSGQFLPGTFVTAEVQVATREVPLAVKTTGLQPFRDFTVVFEQVDSTYEVRMLELGETQGEWAEVLGGIEAGARYVTENSYLIKADVEKSGASHDH
jgi:cobalt-zinc-cadmium efflux system membrane fusion protein